MAKIDDVLAELDLRIIAEKVVFLHERVFHGYRPGKDLPTAPAEFLDMIERYNDYHINATLGPRAGWLPEFKTGEIRKLVEQMYQSNGGLAGAYQVAIIPLDKGIYGIFEQIKKT